MTQKAKPAVFENWDSNWDVSGLILVVDQQLEGSFLSRAIVQFVVSNLALNQNQ